MYSKRELRKSALLTPDDDDDDWKILNKMYTNLYSIYKQSWTFINFVDLIIHEFVIKKKIKIFFLLVLWKITNDICRLKHLKKTEKVK